jgi:hypothetical protein
VARQSQAIDRAAGQPARCIHSGDRESDIYELYCLTQQLGAHFLVRACVDRLAGDGGHTIATEMEETSVNGLHYIDVRNDKGETRKAALEIKFKRIAVLPHIGKQKRLRLQGVRHRAPSGSRGRRFARRMLRRRCSICRRSGRVSKNAWLKARLASHQQPRFGGFFCSLLLPLFQPAFMTFFRGSLEALCKLQRITWSTATLDGQEAN